MAMTKFKVGDRVRAVADNARNSYVNKGDIGKVTSIHGVRGTYYNVEFDVPRGSAQRRQWHMLEEDIELLETPLEDLLAKANEGLRALAELRDKHRDSVETFDVNRNEKPAAERIGTDIFTAMREHLASGYFDGRFALRVKPKPAFEPFDTSNGWRVGLEGDKLHIGCQSFDAKEFSEAVNYLCYGDSPAFECTFGILKSTRRGITYDKHILPWPDAERILEALKKAGLA